MCLDAPPPHPQTNYDHILMRFHLCSRLLFFYLQAQHLFILIWLSRCLWLFHLQDTYPQYLYLEKHHFRVGGHQLWPTRSLIQPGFVSYQKHLESHFLLWKLLSTWLDRKPGRIETGLTTDALEQGFLSNLASSKDREMPGGRKTKKALED